MSGLSRKKLPRVRHFLPVNLSRIQMISKLFLGNVFFSVTNENISKPSHFSEPSSFLISGGTRKKLAVNCLIALCSLL